MLISFYSQQLIIKGRQSGSARQELGGRTRSRDHGGLLLSD